MGHASITRRFRIGVIGFGRMGRGFVHALQQHPMWEIAYICDTHAGTREIAAETMPTAKIVADPQVIFDDVSIHAVGIYTLADVRPELLKRALKANKHVIAEKPLAADIASEWELVDLIENSDRFVAVNLFNRNSWYHKDIIKFIEEGNIGDIAIVRICHMTPGLMPTEGHAPEGPPFHDCGMHYVDVARWYAKSEYDTFHAQGLRMWNHSEPWWVQAHGTFKNGVVFDITQGFVYGHLAEQKTHNSYVDVIGTKGICRMTHDFKTATVELHGVSKTIRKSAPFGDKKFDVMVDVFARSLAAGKNLGFPTVRDSVVASEMAWAMLKNAVDNNPPVRGTPEEMQQILQHRQSLGNGYGLPVRRDPESKSKKVYNLNGKELLTFPQAPKRLALSA
ncbi:hypothetical protein HK102_012426 [Quaeritorhiza haematococci]|nr:hypothetical protein HK102_012426 [Quaeritorhiza haematococci]